MLEEETLLEGTFVAFVFHYVTNYFKQHGGQRTGQLL